MDTLKQISYWLDTFGMFSHDIPSAYAIWKEGNKALKVGHTKEAERYERLNYLLHNSSIPSSCKLGENVQFAYGGIGVILHQNCVIGDGVVIGSNVTVGGKAGATSRYVTPKGRKTSLPVIDDYAYIATGAKILGAVRVGTLAIIGANAVVVSDVPPLTVAAGIPAKAIKKIIPANCVQFKSTFLPLRSLPDNDFIRLIENIAQGADTDSHSPVSSYEELQ